MFRVLLCIAVCLIYGIKVAVGSGTATLEFLSFTKIGHAREDDGSFCDKRVIFAAPCDYFLEICFDPTGGDVCDLIYSDVYNAFDGTFQLPALVFPVVSLDKLKLKLRLFDLDDSNNFKRHDNDFLGEFTWEDTVIATPQFFTSSIETTNGFHRIDFMVVTACDEHYFGIDCTTFCQPADTDVDGHYTCDENGNPVCLDGYMTTTATPCTGAINMCSSPWTDPCVNGGSCSQLPFAVTASCLCQPGYTGDSCEIDINECNLNPCVNGGICEQMQPPTFNCMCAPGFEGSLCETTTNICLLPENICMNGLCSIVSFGMTECLCAPGYEGNRCQSIIDACADNPCLHGGACTQLGPANIQCACLPETTGPRCEVFLNPCRQNSCKNGGMCIPGNLGLFTCVCAEGFSGDTCEVGEDACLNKPCLNNGACTDTIGGFVCCCQEGFSGDRCENSRQVINLIQFLQSFDFILLSRFQSILSTRCPLLRYISFAEVVLETVEDSNCFYGSFYDEARAAGRDVGRVGPTGLLESANTTPARQESRRLTKN